MTYPHKALLALKRIRAALTPEQRRAWGLRLQAIKGGRAAQRMYRMRGIDPCAIARAAKEKKRKLKSLGINEIEKPRSGNTLIYW